MPGFISPRSLVGHPTRAWTRRVPGRLSCVALVALALHACGGGGSSPDPAPATPAPTPDPGPHAIRITVSGLDGSGLVLQNNAGDDLAVSANGSAEFATRLANGRSYAVTVKTQPTLLTQRCTVGSGSGTVSGSAVTDITVDCVSPSTPYLYVANSGANSVAAYKVSAADGTLSSIEVRTSDGLSAPTGIATDPEGRYLYLTNAGDGGSAAISAYAISATAATAGSLQPLTPATASAGSPSGITVSADGKHVYALGTTLGTGQARGFTIQPSGTLAAISSGGTASVGTTPTAVVADPRGRFVYVSNRGAATITVLARDTGTGALSASATRSTGAQPTGLAIDPAGRWLYVASGGAQALATYAIDAATGGLTLVEAKSFFTTPFDVAVHPKGTHVYAVFNSANQIAAYRVDASTGALTEVSGSPYATGIEPSAVRVDGTGRFLYVANKQSNTLSIFSISASTGALTLVGSPSGGSGTSPAGLALVIR